MRYIVMKMTQMLSDSMHGIGFKLNVWWSKDSHYEINFAGKVLVISTE